MRGKIRIPGILLLLLLFVFHQPLRADEGKTSMLELSNYISGNLVFSTYTLIGTINDASYVKGLEKSNATAMLDEQINLMNGAISKYQKVLDSNFLTDVMDVMSMKEFVRCCNLLKEEAEELRTLILSDYKSSSDKYQSTRENAWKSVKDILQLKY